MTNTAQSPCQAEDARQRTKCDLYMNLPSSQSVSHPSYKNKHSIQQ